MTKFTAEDKLAAVKSYLKGGKSYGSIIAPIGTSKRVVADWVMQYQYHGLEGLFKKILYKQILIFVNIIKSRW